MRIQPQNPRENPIKPENPELGRFDPFLGRSGFSRGSRFRHHYCIRIGQGGAPPPDDLGRKIYLLAAAGRARIGPANTTAAATLGCRILSFFGHLRSTHTSLSPFFDPLNSFPWSFSPDSSPFERYDKNKFDRLLDRVFRPPQQPLDQGKGTDVFLVSCSFH